MATWQLMPIPPFSPKGEIFDLVGLRHIHFASIDVEGAEVAVLDSVDWNKVQVDVLCVEANEPVEKLIKALENTVRSVVARYT